MTNFSWPEWVPDVQPLWPILTVLVAGGLITALTFWTYRGTGVAPRRRLALWGLRMAALAVAAIILLRPTWEHKETRRLPGKIVVLFDVSKSMLVQDEDRNMRRWDAVKNDWTSVESLVTKFRDENLQVIPVSFDTKIRDFKPEEDPTGDATGVFQALESALERYKPLDAGQGEALLGMIVYSDGRDNLGKPSLESVLTRLSRLPCPVHTIGLGQPGGMEVQPDLIAMNIDAPQTARVKDKLTVHGVIQAQRFDNQPVEVWLLLDGKEVPEAAIGEGGGPAKPVRAVVRPKNANEIMAIDFPAARLPDKPGDYRLSLRIKPMTGELTETNNEVSTFLSLTKEGLSVLYFDKDRSWEPKILQRALRSDDRITITRAYIGQDKGQAADQWRRTIKELIEKNAFDVFMIGDIPASRFTGGDGGLLQLIEKKVADGAGFVMLGGFESFADGGWDKTPIVNVVPVDMRARGQLEGANANSPRPVPFVPNDRGLEHFALRLDVDKQRNRAWWSKLLPLEGGVRIGRPKANATVLVETPDRDVLFATSLFGKGRTAALAVDTTWIWVRPGDPHIPADKGKEGALSASTEAHLRFWRQLILWLGKQEEPGKNLRVEVAQRRLATGKEQGITVQARRVIPGGTKDQFQPLDGAEFKVTITKPNKVQETIDVSPEPAGEGKSRGVYWRTEEPGEYEIVVTGRFQGADLGETRARFVAFRDDSELVNRSANFAVLEQLAGGTGGTHRLHGGIKEVLDKIASDSVREQVDRTKIPNWQEPNTSLQGGLFLAFVLCVCGEWVLRRLWGLV